MKTILRLSVLLFTLLSLVVTSVNASDWTYVANLQGSWQFSVGDDPEWAFPKIDDSDWDRINVPNVWERFYENYNGYGWYRKEFNVRVIPDRGSIVLFLGRIDDVDEVFVNGVKVGQTGSFFPNYKSAYNVERKYSIPRELLKPTGNLIAVRVYDEGLNGGIVAGNRIGICYDNDYSLLSLDLSGDWRFSTYRYSQVNEKSFDDSKWKSIKVPATWESQGYTNHDGYAWYRKSFKLPNSLKSEKLVFALGKIDDNDRVYLNGHPLGRTEGRNFNFAYGGNWRKQRLYEIPEKYLEPVNVVVVEVYDDHGDGGIYEGPVGLMKASDAKILIDRSNKSTEFHSFWDFVDYLFN